MKSYLEKVEAMSTMDESTIKQLVRGGVNWCNGSIMSISAARKRLNAAILKDGETPTVDTEELHGEAAIEAARERAAELGFAMGEPDYLRRGQCFSSIRKFLIDMAEGRGWDGHDKPREFKEYIESRVKGLRLAEVTDTMVKKEMRDTIGSTAAEARQFLINSNKKQAAKLEEEMLYLIAEDGTYADDLDSDEALDILGVISKHRMRTKFIDGLCYEVDRIQVMREEYSTWPELQTKRHMLLSNALLLQDEFVEFEKANVLALKRAQFENPRLVIVQITDGHRMRLALTRQALEEEARFRKEILAEKMAKEVAHA